MAGQKVIVVSEEQTCHAITHFLILIVTYLVYFYSREKKIAIANYQRAFESPYIYYEKEEKPLR